MFFFRSLFLFFSFFLFLFLYLYCMSAIIHVQLWAASIDGLWPSWQPAVIYILLYHLLLCISYLANKIVVVVSETAKLQDSWPCR